MLKGAVMVISVNMDNKRMRLKFSALMFMLIALFVLVSPGEANAATYASQYAGQSAYPSVIHGQTTTSFLKYKNVGDQPWYDDTAVGSDMALSTTNPVHLATTRPINRFSLVGTAWGGNQNRPALNFAAVYESNGTTLAANQHITQPGQIAKFNITFFGPYILAPGKYREYFQPIVEGLTTMNDPGTFLDVTVVPVSYASQYAGQSAYPTVVKGQTTTSFLKYKNMGNQPWYDSIATSNNPVHLATTRPINRFSLVGTAWGGNQNRPALNFAAVYEADGTTLASNQHTAQPGQIAQFDITFFGPTNIPDGVYREYFQPIFEGFTTMNDPGTFLDVLLVSETD
jgi:hypothetical protein